MRTSRRVAAVLVGFFVLCAIVVQAGPAAATGPWSSAANMATARYAHTATLLPNGTVLVAGGNDGTSGTSAVASAELYDPATNTWSAPGSMATARFGHSATLLPNGKVLVAGGFDGTSAVASAELYDPATNTWSVAGSMATARSYQTATLLPNGEVLVAGGQDVTNSPLASAELYDPGTSSWSSAGNMSDARDSGTATLLGNGFGNEQVLVAGGYDGISVVRSAELYDPATNTWSPTGSMAHDRDVHTATLLGNGKVLVAGGANNSPGQRDDSAELYDPATKTWSAAASMPIVRADHTATLLGNGQVLVAGGEDVSSVLAPAELYDPATNTWSSAGSMAVAHDAPTATLLGNGRVLVTGGRGGVGFTALSSAELYGSADSTPPSVTITTPANNSSFTVGQSVPADYSCQDESGGSGIAACVGDVASGSALDTSTAGTHTFTVNAADNAGNAASALHSYSVLAGSTNGGVTVPPGGGTVTTDPGGLGATAQVPVQTSVQTSDPGTVSISLGSSTQTPPASYTFLGRQVTISAPNATSTAHPLILTFTLDASLNPDPSVIQVARNGVLIPACNTAHSNLPCASIPTGVAANGDLTIGVYTMLASAWNFAVHAAYAFTGFYQPVDNPPVLNVVKAGSGIPVWFALRGNQGLGIMARGYPLSQPVSCDAGARLDAIELTLPARSSSLTYVLGQYFYVWKTENSWSGTCRDLIVKLVDGSVHTARFKFT
jgi:N-acetylneuraminic acid mutarotase